MFSITTDQTNKDAILSKDDYLKMLDGFESRLKPPQMQFIKDCWIFRGDASQTSLKGYGAEPLIASIKEKTLVYCAPRAGAAADAIAKIAELYDKRVVFFCPASKEVSDQQASLLTYSNTELRFIKIAAMPVLNKYAKDWADANDAKFLPFGLANSPLVTAGLIHTAARMKVNPTQIWMAVSTGTAIRAFEIAWPYSQIKGVAVARNMHPGEIGKAELVSAQLPFLKKTTALPPFPSTANYDAKVWEKFENEHSLNALFINVSSDAKIAKPYDKNLIDSDRGWHDMRDMA